MQPRHESVEHRFPGGKCFVVLRVVRDDDHVARVAATRSWGWYVGLGLRYASWSSQKLRL